MALKLAVAISVTVCLVFTAVFLYNYSFSKKLLLANIQEQAQEVLSKNVNEVESVLISISAPARDMAPILARGNLSEAEVEQLLRDPFSHTKGGFGYWVAYDPYNFDPSLYYFCIDVWTEGGELHSQRLGSPEYDYINLHWYTGAKKQGKPVWTEPYYDIGATGELMTTYSVPFFKENGNEKKFLGESGSDIALSWLQKLIGDIKISKSGYAFLISKEGRFISHPRQEFVNKETMFTVAELLGRPYLVEAGKKMIAGESGHMDIISSVTNEPARLFFAPMPLTGWSLGIVVMDDELLASVIELHKRMILMGIVGLLVMITVVVLISKSMSGPLVALATATTAFAGGDMNVADIDIRSGDEIEALNNAFNDLKKRLREKMEELKEYNLTLEEKVKERTKEIEAAHEKLVQQEKLASLGGMAAGIAHEIKNPLNFVTNFADVTTELVDELSNMLKESGSKECLETLKDIRENVVKINEHGRRADSIVKGMLMHSRGKSGEKAEIDLAQMLTESVNLAYHGFRAKDRTFNVSIKTDIAQGLPRITAVPQDISRVLLNMTDNSFYSIQEKAKIKKASYSPEFTVSAKAQNNSVVIKLRDNGLGVPDEIAKKIFEPFFTTKPTGSGTGLGLSISHDIIVKQHGGSLHLETKAGEFAEFTIELPIGGK